MGADEGFRSEWAGYALHYCYAQRIVGSSMVSEAELAGRFPTRYDGFTQ